MTAGGLKALAVAGTLLLAGAFSWAVASVPKPDGAALRPKVVGVAPGRPEVRPTTNPALTQTYVS